MSVIKKEEVREMWKISMNVYAGCVNFVEFNLTLIYSSNKDGKHT
jgi:hypothetical protein